MNFFFVLYIAVRFYNGKEKLEKLGNDKSILEKVCNLIMYDCVVFFFILYSIFNVIWSFIGFSWHAKEADSDTKCGDSNYTGNMMTFWLINCYALVITLAVGLIIFLVTLCIYAMDDGDCNTGDAGDCCCMCMTCGMCDPGKEKRRRREM